MFANDLSRIDRRSYSTVRALRRVLPTAALSLFACSPAADTGSPEESAYAGAIEPLNACGNDTVAPQIFSNTLVTPAALPANGSAPPSWNSSNGRLSRGGYEYISGGGIRFELVTDDCTYIREIKLGNRVITPTYTEGYWYSAQPSTTPPSAPGRLGTNLWVFFPQAREGSPDPLTIVVGRSGGTGTATYTLPLVRVQTVESSDVHAPVGFSRAELWNMFGKSLYTTFNGATNSVTITGSDGSRHRLYGYKPSSLALSLDSSGISFSFEFKLDLNNFCNPDVRAYGRFKVTTNGALTVEWVDPAKAELRWPWLCKAFQLVPLVGLVPNLIYKVIEDNASTSLRSTLEAKIAAALPSTGNGALFLDGSSTSAQELRVHLKIPAPSISLRVPYDAFDIPDRRPVPFGPGETLTLLASGSGMNDVVANVTPQTTLWSGPNGVPLAGTTDWPNPHTVARASNPVWPNAPIARLLARTATGGAIAVTQIRTAQYTPGCALRTPSSPALGGNSVRFGVNDTPANAQQLRSIGAPGYTVRVLFLNTLGATVAAAAPACESATTRAAVAPTQAISFQ